MITFKHAHDPKKDIVVDNMLEDPVVVKRDCYEKSVIENGYCTRGTHALIVCISPQSACRSGRLSRSSA
jgi:hypothetical protein